MSILSVIFAKLAVNIGAKKTLAHHGARHALARKLVKEGAETAVESAIDSRLKKREEHDKG